MGFMNIYVTKNASISVKNNQLFLRSKDKNTDFSLEDINSVMIENLHTTITTYTLAKLAEQGILTFICNQNHLPCGVLLPYCEHYHTLTHFNLQINVSQSLKQQLWSCLVKNKIANQNEVLVLCGIKNDKLKDLELTVIDGDTGNNEAKASLVYFTDLFGKDFARRDENIVNAFLNYGYAIMRAFVARSITAHGLLPFLGIFHTNQLNQYNLADDLMEVFRPVVDLYVKQHLITEPELTTEIKAKIYNLINCDVMVNGQKQTVNYAIELLVQSFIKSLTNNQNLLKRIEICGLEAHQYE